MRTHDQRLVTFSWCDALLVMYVRCLHVYDCVAIYVRSQRWHHFTRWNTVMWRRTQETCNESKFDNWSHFLTWWCIYIFRTRNTWNRRLPVLWLVLELMSWQSHSGIFTKSSWNISWTRPSGGSRVKQLSRSITPRNIWRVSRILMGARFPIVCMVWQQQAAVWNEGRRSVMQHRQNYRQEAER